MLNPLIFISAIGLILLSSELKATPSRTAADDYFLSSLCLSSAGGGHMSTTPSAPPASALYTTRFTLDNWAGELSKEQLDASGARTLLWNASEQLPAARQIKMASSAGAPGLQDFTWSALSNEQRQAMNTNNTGLPDDYGAARVARLRGGSCNGLSGCHSLRRPPLLGDLFNSRPVSVAQPSNRASTMDEYDGPMGAYGAFKSTPRRAQVYVGGNDGALHAFDEQTGEERLAFVPSLLIPRLPALTHPDYGTDPDQHRYFVDGRLVAGDVFFRGAWHTVLLGSLGAGGRGLFALDITDPDRISLLWEFTGDEDNDLGYLLGAPSIVRLHTGQWAAVFGNGQDSPGNSAALLLVEIETGALIKRLKVPAPASALAMPLVTDTNSDGNADYAYAGDAQGNLWRFDLYDTRRSNLDKTAPETTATAEHFRLSFGNRPLFTTAGRPTKPITLAPTLVSHPSETGYLIIVGNGQNHLPDNPNEQTPYTLYGIWDRYTQGQNAQSAASVRFSDLQQQRLQFSPADEAQAAPSSLSRHPINWYASDNQPLGKLGWYLDLRPTSASAAAERLLEPPQKRGELLFFTARAPSHNPCKSADELRLYVIDPSIGGRAPQNVFDLNGDGQVNELDSREGVAPSSIGTQPAWQIVPAPADGMPCLLGDTTCTTISLGARANGRQSWRVVFDAAP